MSKNSWFTSIFEKCKKALADEWKYHRLEVGMVVAALVVGAVLRFDKIEQAMFLSDQGRDAMVVADIFRHGDLVFVGPVTSVGNMYLGPFYYYFMLPWLLVSYPSPMGPVIGVAIVNCIAIVLMYALGQKMVGHRAAAIASVLLSLSSIAVEYSRFSWNPNLTIIGALLLYYFLCRAWENPRYWWVNGLLMGLLLQLHYVNLIPVAVAGLVWLAQIWTHRGEKRWYTRTDFWRQTLMGIGVLAVTFVPLVLFDWKHGWFNISALSHVFVQEESFVAADASVATTLMSAAKNVWGRVGHVATTLMWPTLDIYYPRVILGAAIVVFSLALSWERQKLRFSPARNILVTTVMLSVIILAFYQHSLFNHYILYLIPVWCWWWGDVLAWNKQWWAYITGAFMLLFVAGNWRPTLYRDNPMSIAHQQAVVDKIIEHLPAGETYNLVAVGESRDYAAQNYRYLLSTKRSRLLDSSESDKAQHLFIIDEMGDTDFYGTPIFEIITYPEERKSETLTLPGQNVKIYHWEHSGQ
ncbi:glycosyltransferase family 39 protein [bacterium]|nr:glycosyltransferase family 39 protein [bacterium]